MLGIGVGVDVDEAGTEGVVGVGGGGSPAEVPEVTRAVEVDVRRVAGRYGVKGDKAVKVTSRLRGFARGVDADVDEGEVGAVGGRPSHFSAIICQTSATASLSVGEVGGGAVVGVGGGSTRGATIVGDLRTGVTVLSFVDLAGRVLSVRGDSPPTFGFTSST